VFPVTPLFEAEAVAIFAGMSVAPSDARKEIINDVVVALKNGGVFENLDCLYVLAAHSDQPARVNWIAPGTHDLTVTGSVGFTTDEGYKPTTTGANVLLSDYNPTDDAINFLQNDACIFVRPFEANTSTTFNSAGVRPGASDTGCSVKGTVGAAANVGGSVNGQTTGDGATREDVTGVLGVRGANRSGSTSMQVVIGGSLGVNSSFTSTGVPNGDFIVCGSRTVPSTLVADNARRLAAAGWGGALTAGQWTALNDALDAYLAAIGV
jgi:hypothetical protein